MRKSIATLLPKVWLSVLLAFAPFSFAQAPSIKSFVFSPELYGEASVVLNQSLQVNAPSYPCEGKLSNVERLICQSPQLAVADALMLTAYKKELESLTDEQKATTKQAQLQWLKTRNLCKEEGCILTSQLERIGQYSAAEVKPFKFLLRQLNETRLALAQNTPASPTPLKDPIDYFDGNTLWGCLTSNSFVKCFKMDSITGATTATITKVNNFSKLSVGGGTACALLADKKIKCFGFCGDFDLCHAPKEITEIDDVAVGMGHNCVLSHGKVSCWGDNFVDVLAVPSNLTNVTKIFSGPNNSCALLGKTELRCWGLSDNGILLPPNNMGEIQKVSIGPLHMCALNTAGKIFCWGAGKQNKHTYPDYGQSKVPMLDASFSDVSAGKFHSCALSNNKVICWGDDTNYATKVPENIGPATQVSAKSLQSCALTAKGVMCWGMYEDDSSGKAWGVRETPITLTN